MQTYDGAVGDISIMAQRFESVDFSVAYLEADIVMVVKEKQDKWKSFWVFFEAFEVTVWLLIPTIHLFISSVIWVIERRNNEELKGFGSMLWFSVSLISYMQSKSFLINPYNTTYDLINNNTSPYLLLQL